MAVQLDQNGKDDLKTQFVTREGTYRLMTLSEYSRPSRVGYQTNQNNPQVRVSLVTLPASPGTSLSGGTQQQTNSIGGLTNHQSMIQQPPTSSASSSSIMNNPINGQPDLQQQLMQHPINNGTVATGGGFGGGDRICFNFGKELYVYAYRGCKKLNLDLSKPIDKKLYKGTNPSCHDFNESIATCDGAPLLVGFTTGQIQLVQPGKREPGRLFNEERFIDKSKVTCLKWLPKSPNLFLASHASGHLYLYNEELPCTPSAPTYQPFKSGDGFSIQTCKSKSNRNPLFKWTFGSDMNCCINEFCFSPCGSMLAIVSQDGFLRVFNYDKMELLGVARSYFGGFLCVCWSPDGKYIVVGGEDDLVTVWSLHERRVVARGQGHRSWVSVVAFDPYTSYSNWDGPDFSDDENPINDGGGNHYRYNSATENNCYAKSTDVDCESNPIIRVGEGVRQRPQSSTSSFRDSQIVPPDKLGSSYRLGSVSQDTQLCLWDITEDTLRQSYEIRQRLSSYDPQVNGELGHHNSSAKQCNDIKVINPIAVVDGPSVANNTSTTSSTSSTSSSTATDNSIKQNHSINSNKIPLTTSSTSAATTSKDVGDGAESGRSSINENIDFNSKHIISSNSKSTTSTTTATSSTSNNSGKLNCINSGKVNSNSSSSTAATESNKSSSQTANAKNESSGQTTFNSLTQRLTNFSFGNDKNKSSDASSHSRSSNNSHSTSKKSFTFSKSTGNHAGFLHYNSSSSNSNSSSSNNQNNTDHSSMKNKSNNSSTSSGGGSSSSYDPLQLIGTSVCPRFDECPLLEPLVCKKIAHERLTALIFREDCFLTACQDGFIYTWARPGFSNIPQHIMTTSPTAPPGGTVV